jgi:hypothetical protein
LSEYLGGLGATVSGSPGNNEDEWNAQWVFEACTSPASRLVEKLKTRSSLIEEGLLYKPSEHLIPKYLGSYGMDGSALFHLDP